MSAGTGIAPAKLLSKSGLTLEARTEGPVIFVLACVLILARGFLCSLGFQARVSTIIGMGGLTCIRLRIGGFRAPPFSEGVRQTLQFTISTYTLP